VKNGAALKSLGEEKVVKSKVWPRNDVYASTSDYVIITINIIVAISWPPPLISQLFHPGI